MDPLQSLRFRNILNPAGVNSPTMPNGAVQQPQDSNNSNITPFVPAHTAMDAFSSQVANMPKPEDYQPSRMRQIGAVLAGLGTGRPAGMYGGNPVGFVGNPQSAFETSDAIAHRPFDRATAEFNNRIKPIGEAAVMEENRNKLGVQQEQTGELRDVQRTSAEEKRAHDRETENLRRDFQAQTDKYRSDLNTIRETNAETRKAQQAVHEWEAKHPNHKITITPTGIYSTDPKTNQTELLKGEDGLPIESGKLSDSDKLLIEGHNRLAAISAQGDESRKTETVRQSGRESLEDLRQTGRNDLEDHKASNRNTDIRTRGDESRKTKQTPGADKKTTTSVKDKDGKVIGTKDVVTTSDTNSTKIKMKSPDGKYYMVDNKDVEESKKHGWVTQ